MTTLLIIIVAQLGIGAVQLSIITKVLHRIEKRLEGIDNGSTTR